MTSNNEMAEFNSKSVKLARYQRVNKVLVSGIEFRGRPKFGFGAETDSFCGFGGVSVSAEVQIHLSVNFRFRPKVTVNFGCNNLRRCTVCLNVFASHQQASQSCNRPEPPRNVGY